MDLNAVIIFLKVVRLGSFTKAAQDLRLPKSTVSDRISDLEKELGVNLLVRTTRKLHLTEAGAGFFKKVETAAATILDAGEEVSSYQKRPTGTLKITAPADFDNSVISEAVLEYLEKFPEVKVELHFTDRIVDIVGEGFDIAIRVGHLKDSSLTAKMLGNRGLILVASPKYLQKTSPIVKPQDLLLHKCILFLPEEDANSQTVWRLVSSRGKKVNIEPRAGISSNSSGAIWNLVAHGEGIALMPPTLVCNDASRARMVHVLKEWSTASLPTYLIYPSHRNSSPKVREMIPILEPRLRKIVDGT